MLVLGTPPPPPQARDFGDMMAASHPRTTSTTTILAGVVCVVWACASGIAPAFATTTAPFVSTTAAGAVGENNNTNTVTKIKSDVSTQTAVMVVLVTLLVAAVAGTCVLEWQYHREMQAESTPNDVGVKTPGMTAKKAELVEPLMPDRDEAGELSDDDIEDPRRSVQESAVLSSSSARSFAKTFLWVVAGVGDVPPPVKVGPPMLVGNMLCLLGLHRWNGVPEGTNTSDKDRSQTRGKYEMNPLLLVGLSALDWVDAILDFGLTDSLRVRGKHSYAAWLGFGTAMMVAVQVGQRWLLNSPRGIRSKADPIGLVWLVSSIEIAVFFFEDSATLFAFASVNGLFDRRSWTDVANLVTTIVSAPVCVLPFVVLAVLFPIVILEVIRKKTKGGDNQIGLALSIWAATVAISSFFGWQLYVASTILGDGHKADKTVVANMFYTSWGGLLSEWRVSFIHLNKYIKALEEN
jgi:hypothetical protein